uniref:SWIM-type domain-containing protein n=1 Tax=Panagrolaimus davidi TaxID=227884 RepID=A0A914QQ72_9BILA
MAKQISGKYDGGSLLGQLSALDEIQVISDSLSTISLNSTRSDGNGDKEPENEDLPVFITKNSDLTEIGKLVFNLENSHDGYKVTYDIPDSPPNVKGTHICVISTFGITDVRAVRSDGMGCWTNKDNKYNNDKIGLFNKDGKLTAKTRQLQGAEHIFCVCRMNHPSFAVSKNIYWAQCVDKNIPVPGTFFVIVYNVKETFQLPEVVKKPLDKATSAQLKRVIFGKTATEARNEFYSNGGLVSNNSLVSVKQIQNMQNRTENWDPTTKKGRPRNEDPEVVRRLLEEGYFLRSHYQSDKFQDDRYFFATNAHLHYFKSLLMKKKQLQKFVDLAEKLLEYPESERYQKAKEMINEKEYIEWMLAAICSLDVTFNIGAGYILTLLICSSQHIRNPNNDPHSIIVAGMISRTHTKADMEWMAGELIKRIDCKNLFARCLITDAERSLDGLTLFPAFQHPCVRVNCDIHGEENIKRMSDNDSEIIKDLYGSNEGGFHRKGLLDEFDFEIFYDKITNIATTASWQKYPKLLQLVASPSRLRYFYDRHNLKIRIAAGFGFKKSHTNRSENAHQLIKTKKLKDNLPLQDIIKNTQDFMVEELLNICHVYYDNSKCKLYDQTQFLGPVKWKNLTEEEMREKWRLIYITDTDLLPGLETLESILPHQLVAKLSEEQRKTLINAAKSYIVYHSEAEPDYYSVTKGADIRKICISKIPITCDCNLVRRKVSSLCPHLLAISIQHPRTNIIKKMVDYIASETVPQKNKRLLTAADASKPQHARRRGTAESRKGGSVAPTDIFDFDNDLSSVSSSSTLTGGRKRGVSGSSQNTFNSSQSTLSYNSDLFGKKSKITRKSSKRKTHDLENRYGDMEVIDLQSPYEAEDVIVLENTYSLITPSPSTIPPASNQNPTSSRNAYSSTVPALPRLFPPHPPNKQHVMPCLPPPRQITVPPRRPEIPIHPRIIVPRPVLPQNNIVIAPRVPTVQRNIVNTKSERRIQQIIDLYYHRTGQELPPYLTYHPFVLTKIKNVTNYQARRCAREDCRMELGGDLNNVVVTHFEPYTYLHPQKKKMETAHGVRVICPSMICMERRYPYITKECFIIDPSITEAQAILNTIVRER